MTETGWQPIETAPKDGTEVIGVFSNDYGYQSTPTVYGPWTMAWRHGEWQSSWDEAQVVESMSDFGTTMKSLDLEPTHWMPLPAPPALTTEKQQ